MIKPNLGDTIVAISTPLGEGAIGIVRMSGQKALEIADEIFVPKDGRSPSEYETYTTHYGHVVEKGRSYIDEAILTVMKAPKSYTKEDIVEINCHGGPAVIEQVLELVVKLGARIAEPGELTRRAFINGRIDLAKAEAVLDIIRAKTDSSARAALSQLEGGLSSEINEFIESLSRILSHVEAAIDFPDEELEIMEEEEVYRATDVVKKDIERLLSTAEQGIILREGVLAIICGKPNVGKSSLMNLLLKRDRVIVTPIPGTTRDAVEEVINLKGFPIRLVDTAGISDTKDALDREGAERSRRYLKMADIVLFALDGSMPLEEEDLAIGEIVKEKKVLAIINKIDLGQKIFQEDVKRAFGIESAVGISILKRKNIEVLGETILKVLTHEGVFRESAMVTNVRHKTLLDSALRHIESAEESMKNGTSAEFLAQDLREAIYQLGLIVGRSVSDDILDRIFGEFCIGK